MGPGRLKEGCKMAEGRGFKIRYFASKKTRVIEIRRGDCPDAKRSSFEEEKILIILVYFYNFFVFWGKKCLSLCFILCVGKMGMEKIAQVPQVRVLWFTLG